MSAELTDLDIVSSAFFVGEAPGDSHSMATLIRLEGRADLDALIESVNDAYVSAPRFRARVVNRGGPLWPRWAWRPDPRPEPVRVLESTGHDPDQDLATVVDAFYDRGRRARDLRRHQTTRCSIGALSPDVTVLALERHHAAGDAVAGLVFLRDVFAGYHRRVTGRRPGWADVAPMHAAPSAARRRGAGLTDLVRRRDEIGATGGDGEPLLRVSGTPSADARQLVARATIADPDTIGALRRRARGLGASLTDVMIAATMRAVRDLNDQIGVGAGRQRYIIPVAQPARDTTRNANELSQIVVGCGPDDLDDGENLVRSLGRRRVAAFDAGVDITLSRILNGLARVPVVRPGGPLSRRLASRTTSGRSGPTAVFSNPGVFWPELRDGRPTGAMAFTEAGGLRLADHQTVFNGGPQASLLATTFDRRLRIDLAQNATRMNQAEMDAFISAVRGELLGLL